MRILFCFISAFFAWTCFAKYYPHWDCALADVAVRVVDETNTEVPDAEVTFVFYVEPEKVEVVKCLSDKRGMVYARNRCNGEAYISIRKSGYYNTGSSRTKLAFQNVPLETTEKTHKWSDGPVRSDVVLKRIVNPQNIKWLQYRDYVFPATNQVIGFDLKMDDWCKPYGRGEYDDLQFKANFWHSPTNWFRFYSKLEISMTNSVDGFYWSPVDAYSNFMYAHHADTNAVYSKSVVFELDRRSGKKYTTKIDIPQDKYLVFRTRTKVDAEGKLVQATYGFIGEGMEFIEKIRFMHILNPVVNDTNLELNITPPNQ